MKLRMALRLSKRETEAGNAGMNLKAIATEAAQNTLATVNKDILIDKSLENEMWLMFNWGDCGFNANLVTIMSGTKDPRQPLYMTLNTGDIKNEAGTTTVAANSQYLVSVLPVACLPNQTVGVTSPVGFKETTVPLIPCHCPS